MKGIQKQVRLEKYDTIEPTQWPQEFNFRAAKAICVDCVSVSLIVFTPQGPITIKTEVTASATFTDLGSSDPHKADWVWGDNTLPTPGTVTESNGSGSVSDSHTYTSAGSYYVQITITNNDGGIANSQSHINVDNPDLHKTIHILQLD